jgi:hypothetical protein
MAGSIRKILMIIWVFFDAGAGGDGVANLLEHSSNAVSIDGKLTWRIHRYIDNTVKFWAPNLPGLDFRTNTVNHLTEQHVRIANSNDQFLIITSHDLQFANVFLNSSLPENNHIKLLLTSKDFIKQQINFNTKNLVEFNQLQLKPYRLSGPKHGPMDFVIDVDRITDWEYTKEIISKIGLQLGQENFEHYKKIVEGEIMYDTPGIEYYKSFIDNGITKYLKIN